jgi:hypothetical protein
MGGGEETDRWTGKARQGRPTTREMGRSRTSINVHGGGVATANHSNGRKERNNTDCSAGVVRCSGQHISIHL